MKRFAAVLGFVLWPAVHHAGPTQQILDHYAEVARQVDPGFDGFSAERGEKLYHEKGIIRGLGFVTVPPATFPTPAK